MNPILAGCHHIHGESIVSAKQYPHVHYPALFLSEQPNLPLSSMAEVTFALLLPAKKWNNTIDFVHQHLACYLSMSEFTTAI